MLFFTHWLSTLAERLSPVFGTSLRAELSEWYIFNIYSSEVFVVVHEHYFSIFSNVILFFIQFFSEHSIAILREDIKKKGF